MKTFHLVIITPVSCIFDGDVEFAVFPGAEGELGILHGHAPLISLMKEGSIKALSNGTWQHFAVSTGVFEVRQNMVSVVSEQVRVVTSVT
jgi:F-type H+-transporting ATPase subunit epsilon